MGATSPAYLPPRPSRVPDFRTAEDADDDHSPSGSSSRELHVHMLMDPRRANPQPLPHRDWSPSATPMPPPPRPPPTAPDDPGTLPHPSSCTQTLPRPLSLTHTLIPASSLCSHRRHNPTPSHHHHLRPAACFPSRPALRRSPRRRATVKLAAALCVPSPAGYAETTARMSPPCLPVERRCAHGVSGGTNCHSRSVDHERCGARPLTGPSRTWTIEHCTPSPRRAAPRPVSRPPPAAAPRSD